MLKQRTGLALKACPRCGGDISFSGDMYGAFWRCAQCGWMKDVDTKNVDLTFQGLKKEIASLKRPTEGNVAKRVVETVKVWKHEFEGRDALFYGRTTMLPVEVSYELVLGKGQGKGPKGQMIAIVAHVLDWPWESWRDFSVTVRTKVGKKFREDTGYRLYGLLEGIEDAKVARAL